MAIDVDEAERRVTFLYRLGEGVAQGSFGMHCTSMCEIPRKVVESAEVAAKEWEHTSRLTEGLEVAKRGAYVPLGWQSDIAWMLKKGVLGEGADRGVEVLMKTIAGI
jgi:DNA mismatch repair protein MSH6